MDSVQLDKITEAIAHFIGLFQTDTEQARLRDEYFEFRALRAHEAQPDQHDPGQISFQAPYAFNDPDPGLHYVPAAPVIEPERVLTPVAYARPGIPVPLELPAAAYPHPVGPRLPDHHSGIGPIELIPPGSVAAHIAQINHLTDNDFMAVNTGPADFHAIGQPMSALEALFGDAVQFSPIDEASFGTTAAIGDFSVDTAASLSAFVAETTAAQSQTASDPLPPAATDDVTVHAKVTAFDELEDGSVYVNGRLSEEAPKLDDVLPAASPLVKDEAGTSTGTEGGGNHLLNGPGAVATPGSAHGQGEISNPASVELGTGGNALVNSATMINDALEGNVFAVAGDHFSLNAIIQVNAWSDSDSIGGSLGGWGGKGQDAATSAFNVAGMQRIDISGMASGDAALAGFPKAWAVTEIHGDFVSLNWVQQFNFLIDNDTGIFASSSGVTTKIGMGENQAFNSLSIADLGRQYDLVLVGGSYYDANIITQTNVLLDDDVVGALAGFQTSGAGTISTGDNLLWNSANITSLGSDTAHSLPDGFRDALQNMADDNKALPSSVFTDSAFQGLAGLKVLYISGSVYDLQYISQTNVLGDADHIALAMNPAKPNLDAGWSITTGSNALVNSARIIDVDPAGKTYFGGDHYSDELLVQTDIIRTDHLLESRDGDHLVNEAVAFLSDDMIGKAGPDNQAWHLKDDVGVHPGHSDIMQSVLS